MHTHTHTHTVETFRKLAIHEKFAQIRTSYMASFSKDELQKTMLANQVLVYHEILSNEKVEAEAAVIFCHSYSSVDAYFIFGFVVFYLLIILYSDKLGISGCS